MGRKEIISNAKMGRLLEEKESIKLATVNSGWVSIQFTDGYSLSIDRKNEGNISLIINKKFVVSEK